MKKSLFVCLAFLLICLTACSGNGKEDVTTQEVSEETFFTWREQNFNIADSVTANQTIWTDKFSLIDVSSILKPEDEIFQCVFLGKVGEEVYYLYDRWNPNQKENTYTCVSYNISDGSQTVKCEFTMSGLGYEARSYLMFGACITEAGTLILDTEMYYSDEGTELVRKRIWTYVESNKIIKEIDMTSFLSENGLFAPLGFIGTGENQVCVTEDGLIYYMPINIDGDVSYIYAFDGEGTLLTEYKVPMYCRVCRPIKTEDGDYLFAVACDSEKRTTFMYYDKDRNAFLNKANIENYSIVTTVGMHGKTIYYSTPTKVISWDVVTGERNECYNLGEMGLYNQQSFSMLWLNQGLYIRFKDDAGEWLVSTSPSELINDSSIVVADVYGKSQRIKLAVTTAKMQNRNTDISLVSAKSEADKTRIYTELATGKGPDVMLVSRDDMYNLAAKGLLADMEEIIGESNKNRLISSATEVGTVDGVFYGVPQGVALISLQVYKDTIEGDTWSYEQFTDAVLSGKIYPGIKIGESLCSSAVSFKILTQLNLSDSFFIDWENKQSRFFSPDVKRFIEALGDIQLINMLDTDVDMKNVYFSDSIDLLTVESFRSENNDEEENIDYFDYIENSGYKYIGFPTSGGNGNFLEDNGVIVVNANTTHKEEVRRFIECFLSDDVQKKNISGDYYLSVTGYGIDDFVPYIENSVPIPSENSVIRDIVFQEITSYFAHDKTLEQALEIIDSRVQLYLDE